MKKTIIKIVIVGISIMMFCGSCSNTHSKITQQDNTIETTQEIKNVKEKDKSSSLLYIMPQYKEEIYSRAYFRQFVKTELAVLRDCYGQLAERLNNEQMDKQEKSVAMKNYEQIEELVLNAEKNEIEQEKYEKLPKVDYMSYISKNTDYDENESISRSNFTINIDSINTYDMYYTFDCDIYRPYLISKEDVEKLKKIFAEDEESATKIIEVPLNKEGMISSRKDVVSTKKIKLYYDGAEGFLYYVNGKEKDDNLREISIKTYNNEYYAFYEDDEYIIEHPEKSINISILKDANIGQGQSFKQIAMADDEYNFGDDDIKYYYNITDLFRRIVDNEKTLFSEKSRFVGNYLKFDEKGYVTDFYNFSNEE